MIIAIDEGTSSTRALLINEQGQILKTVQKEIKQIYPEQSWVEHDPVEIYQKTLACVREILEDPQAQGAKLAITNQRETTVIWDKNTGKPVYNAIVWQCKRSKNICDEIKNDTKLSNYIRQHTGLIIDSYFSASKIIWLLKNIIHKENLNLQNLLFGTIDTWLIWNLTGNHYTDSSNASRTMLFDIHKNTWDKYILDQLEIPESLLPTVLESNANFGLATIGEHKLPIKAVLGDQQAAFYAYQNQAKATYGTGTFILFPNSGSIPEGLVVSNAYTRQAEIKLCTEASIFVGGSLIQWLRDQMKFIKSSSEIEEFAANDNGGLYFIPALAGLASPFWREDIRGTIFGITRATSQAHIARAALEAIAYRVRDVFEVMKVAQSIKVLNVDGGASKNNSLMQFQADLLGIDIVRYKETEMTALGLAAMTGEVKLELNLDRTFSPLNNYDSQYKEWKSYLELLIGNVKNSSL